MPNSIALFQKYIDQLDEVYRLASKSSVLDSGSDLVRAGSNAHTIQIPKMSMDGLGDYDRNAGYAQGSVNITYEDVAFNYDRGRKFSVDVMDDEETAGVAFGRLAAEFVRMWVVPEIDAVRFATYASKANNGDSAQLATADAWLAALTAAKTQMDDDEVSEESRYLFITPTGKNLIDGMETYKSRAILDSFAQVIAVPASRFCTEVTLKDGTTSGEEAGGFTAAGPINFMIVEKSAVMQYTKHVVSKVITPEENQTTDGYLFFYRTYGLHDVYDNKTTGIYSHTVPVES